MAGIDDAVARALTSITQVMPAHLRADVDAMHLTAVRNYWEFPAPPVASDTLRAVGCAVRNAQLLRFDELAPDGLRPDPRDPDFVPPVVVEPHHLVQWAARWYLVAFVPAADSWRIFRLERLHVHTATGRVSTRRELPHADVARYVMTSYDRGDTPAHWPCQGSVLMALPPELVADITAIEPPPLAEACRTIARRYARADAGR